MYRPDTWVALLTGNIVTLGIGVVIGGPWPLSWSATEPVLGPSTELSGAVVPRFALSPGRRLIYDEYEWDGAPRGLVYARGRGTPSGPVRTVGDLRRVVRLRSAREALAYVRLFTSPDTYLLGCIERTTEGAIRGLELYSEVDARDRRRGVVWPSDRLYPKLRRVHVARIRGRWRIERDIAVMMSVGRHEGLWYRVYRSREWVYRDGSYRHRIGKVVGHAGDVDPARLLGRPPDERRAGQSIPRPRAPCARGYRPDTPPLIAVRSSAARRATCGASP